MCMRAAYAFALVTCLVIAPITLARESDQARSKDKQTKKQVVKKEDARKSVAAKAKTDRGSAWHGKDGKSGAAPTVRAVPFRPTTQPARAARPAHKVRARPDNPFIFTSPERYDYFADHYGASQARSSSGVMGYVPPTPSSPNSGNPFVYRRQ